jgi:lysozyme family protein
MATFQAYLPKLEKVEGGFQKLVKDKGNYNSLNVLVGTNWGISAQTYELWIKRPPTELDIRNMPKSTAINIFKIWYWDKLQADSFKNQSVANLIVDHGVNAGTTTAIKMLQTVLNKDFSFNLKTDGIIGNKTITALNSVNQEVLHQKILQARVDFYKKIGGTFLNAWLNRLSSFFFQENKARISTGTAFLLFAASSFFLYKILK